VEIVLAVAAFFVVLLVGIVVVGRRRRRAGWSDDPAQRPRQPHSMDGRGAVNQNSWMLGGGGGAG
jgi:hypothetical protein